MMKKFLCGLLVVAAASVGRGATFVWDGGTNGGGTAWMTTNNWSPDGLPGSLDAVVFSTTNGTAGTIGINFGATTAGVVEIAQIIITNATSRFIENSSTSSNGIFRFSGGGVIVSNGAGGTFRFRNGAAGTTMTMELTGDSEIFAGGAPVVFSNRIVESGGSWRLTKSGASALRLSSSNSYSGGTVVFAGSLGQNIGALMVDDFNALGSGDVAFSNTTSLTMLMFGAGAGVGTLKNNISITPLTPSTTNRFVSSRGVGGVATLAGLISGGSADSQIIIDNEISGDRGQIRLSNSNNTFRTGRFILNNGGLVFDSDGALGDTNNTITLNLSSGTPDTGLIFGDSITLSPSRTIKFTQQGRIDVQSFTGTVSGMVTNDSTINKWGAGTLNFDGPVRQSAVGTPAFLNNGGMTFFNNACSVTGTVTINTGTVVIGASGSFPNMTTLTLASNTLFDASAVGGHLISGSSRSVQGFGSVTGGFALATRARLFPGTLGTVGTLTFKNGLTQDGTVTNVFDIGGNPADLSAHDVVNVDGVLASAGDVIVLNAIAALSSNGSYRLFNCDTSSVPSFALVPLSASRFTAALDVATPGQVNVQLAGESAMLVWNATASNAWDVQVTTNWINVSGATNDVFFQQDHVVFDDAAGVLTNVALFGALTPQSVSVTSSVNNFQFFGGSAGARLSGAAPLLKSGDSTLTLALTNTDYSGTITISGGTLLPRTTNALGTAAGATVVNGGTLDVNGLNIGSEPVMIAGVGVGGAGAIVNSGAAQNSALQYVTLLTNASVGGVTRWDIRAGSGPFLNLNGHTLTKNSTNQISLATVSATNDGSIVINQGVISVEAGTLLSGAGEVAVNAGAALNFFSAVTNLKTVAMKGGTIGSFLGGTGATNDGPVVLTSNAYVVAAGGAGFTFAGSISGAGGLIITAANPVALSGANSFAGDVIVATGTLKLASSGALGASTNVTLISLYGGAGNTGTRFELINGVGLGTGVVLQLPSAGPGDTVRSTFFNTVGTNTWYGTTKLSGDGNINIASETTGSVLTVAGPVIGSSFTGTVFFRGNTGNGFLSGAVNIPTGIFSKPDGGTWTISSTGNVWSIAHLRNGALRLAAPNALCETAPFQFGLGAEFNNTILDLGGYPQTVGRIISSGAGGTKLIGNGSTTSDATLVISGVAFSTNTCTIVDGVLGGTNRTGVTIQNGAVVLQSAASTYTGPTFISNATLRISTFNTTPLGKSVVTIDPTGIFEADTANGSRTLTNNFTGGGQIVKVSANNFVTRGSNTFSGLIRVNAGYFVFDHTDSDNGVPALEFNGGNLALPEMFAANPLTISSLAGISTVSVIDPNYNSVPTGNTPVVRVLLVAQTNDTSFAGSIRAGLAPVDRNISLQKHGSGILTLLGTNTYGGPTIVSNGTLLVGGTLGTGAVTVAADATLGGIGIINGPVTSDGVVAPGASPGILTITKPYTQNAGATLRLEIGGLVAGAGYDQLALNGCALGGALVVTLTNAFAPALNDGFVLINDNANSIATTFATANLPSLGGGLAWDLQYFPNAVLLSVVTNAAPPPPAGYDLYATQITNGLTGIQDDADGDGYANLLEYVTGANPTTADTLARMNGIRIGGLLALQFTRTSNSVDTTIIVEGANASTNDAPWTGIATNINGSWGSATNVIETNGPALFNVTAFDTDPSTNRFLRLRVTRP